MHPSSREASLLAYKITNWSHAPGVREAHDVRSDEGREPSRRRTRAQVQSICRQLGEQDTPPIHRAIFEVTRKLGFKRAGELVTEARAIFDGPGMLVLDGSRNRSLGGIFFQLAERATRGPRSEP
jgi:uncharacterized phage-associated protein